MSTESNSVMQVSLRTAMSPNLYRADEPRTRKPERAQASFLDTIVGRRGGLRPIFAQLKAVAPTNSTVLISGESGTGKAVIARALHELSPRRNRNLVKVNFKKELRLPTDLLFGFLERVGKLQFRINHEFRANARGWSKVDPACL